jgi:hypothetical protein
MMPHDYIPYLLHKLGVKEDSLLEGIVIIIIFLLMCATGVYIAYENGDYRE